MINLHKQFFISLNIKKATEGLYNFYFPGFEYEFRYNVSAKKLFIRMKGDPSWTEFHRRNWEYWINEGKRLKKIITPKIELIYDKST